MFHRVWGFIDTRLLTARSNNFSPFHLAPRRITWTENTSYHWKHVLWFPQLSPLLERKKYIKSMSKKKFENWNFMFNAPESEKGRCSVACCLLLHAIHATIYVLFLYFFEEVRMIEHPFVNFSHTITINKPKRNPSQAAHTPKRMSRNEKIELERKPLRRIHQKVVGSGFLCVA